MELITDPLTKTEIENLQKTYGNYLKLTIDIENGLSSPVAHYMPTEKKFY